jgi:hypothetical protein
MSMNDGKASHRASYSFSFVQFVADLHFGFRIFFLPSDFWFRISDFKRSAHE